MSNGTGVGTAGPWRPGFDGRAERPSRLRRARSARVARRTRVGRRTNARDRRTSLSCPKLAARMSPEPDAGGSGDDVDRSVCPLSLTTAASDALSGDPRRSLLGCPSPRRTRVEGTPPRRVRASGTPPRAEQTLAIAGRRCRAPDLPPRMSPAASDALSVRPTQIGPAVPNRRTFLKPHQHLVLSYLSVRHWRSPLSDHHWSRAMVNQEPGRNPET
jgi:hypothetical protein